VRKKLRENEGKFTENRVETKGRFFTFFTRLFLFWDLCLVDREKEWRRRKWKWYQLME